MGAEIILTTQFNTSQSWNSGILDYLDREDKKVFQDKVIKFEDINENEAAGLMSIEKEAYEIASSNVSDMGEFSRFLDYMDREKAMLNKSKLSIDEEAQLKVINLFKNECKEEISSTFSPEKNFNQTNMFSSTIDNFSVDDKDLFKDRFALAERAGANLWKDVVSFETDFLIKQRLYDPEKNQLDTKRLIEASRKMMADYFKKENLEDTGFWVGEIHYNTEHFHIHFATSEVKNTRKIQELELKNGKVVLAPRGKRKQSTIDSMKRTFMNELVDRDMELNKQSELRNNLVQEIKNRLQRNQNQEAVHLLESLEKKLPKNKRKWNSKNIFKDRETKQLMIRLIDHQMKDSKLFSDFKNQIREEHAARQKMYGKSNQKKNNYYQNRLDDIYYRLSNSILTELKKEGFKDKEKSLDIATDWLVDQLKNKNFSKSTQSSIEELEKYKKISPRKKILDDVEQHSIKSDDHLTYSPYSSVVDGEKGKGILFEEESVFENNLSEFSLNNQRLITKQYENATCVHNRNYWMFQGRKIQDGEKGIVIKAPVFDSEDDTKLIGFEEVMVYDINQTTLLSMEERKLILKHLQEKEEKISVEEFFDVEFNIEDRKIKSAFMTHKSTLESFINREKRYSYNLDEFSKNNQKLILDQYKEAVCVHSPFFWIANERKVMEHEKGIVIKAPVFENEGDSKPKYFEEIMVYDIKQTIPIKNKGLIEKLVEGKSFQEQVSDASKKITVEKNKNVENNIGTFSLRNQEKIKDQYPTAVCVHNEYYWLAHKRKIRENEYPIQITAPVIENGRVSFVVYSVFDISQTEKFKNNREWEKAVRNKIREDINNPDPLVRQNLKYLQNLNNDSNWTNDQYRKLNRVGYKIKGKSMNALKREMTTNDDYERQKALWEHEQINRKVEYKKKQQEWELS